MSVPQTAASSRQPAQAGKPTLSLSRDVMEQLKPARVFKDAVNNTHAGDDGQGGAAASSSSLRRPLQLTSIGFDDTGDRCVTTGEDDVFTVYDSRKGKKLRTLYSKKYGIAHARFAHRRENIIHASTKGDHAVRYHSMHDNKYLSYFQGHTGTVRSLQMNPTNDTFISAGDDRTVRLWDLRTSSCRGMVNDVGGSTLAAFDADGIVFAAGCSANQTIMLFDCTSLDDAPFAHAAFVDVALSSQQPRPTLTSLAFSNNGSYLLVGTSSNVHYVLDAFDLAIVRRLEGHQGLGLSSGEEVSWSADSSWVLSGSADGTTVLWDLTPPKGTTKLESPGRDKPAPTLQPTAVLKAGDGQHAATRAVTFNPRYGMLAVGGEELSFWLPPGATEMEEGW